MKINNNLVGLIVAAIGFGMIMIFYYTTPSLDSYIPMTEVADVLLLIDVIGGAVALYRLLRRKKSLEGKSDCESV